MRRAIALDGVRPTPEPEPVAVLSTSSLTARFEDLAAGFAALESSSTGMIGAMNRMAPALEQIYRAQLTFGEVVRRRPFIGSTVA